MNLSDDMEAIRHDEATEGFEAQLESDQNSEVLIEDMLSANCVDGREEKSFPDDSIQVEDGCDLPVECEYDSHHTVDIDDDACKEEKSDLEKNENSLARIRVELESIRNLFQEKILRSEREGQIIDKMHSELQDYRSDLYVQLLRPVLNDIIALREHILKLAADYSEKAIEEQFVPLEIIASYGDDLATILEDNEVEVYSCQAGDPFDPTRNKAIAKVETDDAELDKSVAATFGEGYLYRDRVVSAQKVSVYVAKLKQESENVNDCERNKNG